ncbi:MAG: ribbon-helix-helix protein, CopG family [Deltaproteobacteria bacterium]|nr:ribbon-helix-helix protein, CopG family [Deltaproteobacteria bacterium]
MRVDVYLTTEQAAELDELCRVLELSRSTMLAEALSVLVSMSSAEIVLYRHRARV